MHIVDVRDVLTATEPKKTTAIVEAIVGHTLGEISVQQLMLAAHGTKAETSLVAVGSSLGLREVHREEEEE